MEYTNGIMYLHTDWETGCPCRQVKGALEHRSSNKPQAESILGVCICVSSGVDVAQIPLQISKRLFCFCLSCADGKLFSKK